MALQVVTPEDLDAWLQSTVVTEEEDHGIEPLPVEVPVRQKRKAWRRRSSLDEENISDRPCFGVDASALLANETRIEDDEENSAIAKLNPFFRRSSSGIDTVVASNHYLPSPEQDDFLSFKKRRVSDQYNRQCSSFSRDSSASCNTPYFRLVTDDSCMLDNDAQFSRHASQYTVPSHVMDQEARFSRRSSQFTVSQKNRAVDAFIRAMEVSQRSHKMLMNHHFTMSKEEIGRSEAMHESGHSRSLLYRASQRKAVTGISRSIKDCRFNRSDSLDKKSHQDMVVADLRRMEETLLAEMRRNSEFLD